MKLKELKPISLFETYLLKKGKNPRVVKDTLKDLRDISTLSVGYPRHAGDDINKDVNEIVQ